MPEALLVAEPMPAGRRPGPPPAQPRPIADAVGMLAGALAILGALAWLGYSIAVTREESRTSLAEARRIAELRGEIVHLDEVLTMSARMAAASGDARWIRRYDEHEPKLDAAIQEAVALASPEAAATLSAQTDAANRRLVELEREALGLVTDGQRAHATALLESQEYDTLKATYASGIGAFALDLAARADARARQLAAQGRMQVVALIAVLISAGGMGLRWHMRLRQSLRRTEDVARTDALTGLMNRRGLNDALANALDAPGAATAGVPRAAPEGPAMALLLLDLDGFKAVNDAQGHATGDQLLRAVGARLAGCIRAEDIAARLGGDEFAVLVRPAPGARAQAEAARAAAIALAERVIAALAKPFVIAPDEPPLHIGTSIGIALAPEDAATPATLMHAADLALYEAKARGRGRCVEFEHSLEATSRARAALDAALRKAVGEEAIETHFQPIVDLRSGRVIGHEMLARWQLADGTAIPPDTFIPAAERLGIIDQLTESLLRRACAVATGWEAGETLSCNLSPLLLRDRAWLLDTVGAALAESGLPASRLELELTESALVGDLSTAREALDAVRAIGVRVALDDFGTGYSGLRLLSALTVDRLKIDRSFVRRMHEDEASARIVACVVALADGLGLSVVAEGIEIPGDATALVDLGCSVGQGWLYGRAVPADSVATAEAAPPPRIAATA